jgi:fibronectin type 3 domain-containing protein
MPVSGREDLALAKAGDRAISSYRIYRNGTPVTTTTENTYQDTGLTNGLTYSYYVTTVYANPAGESAASNSASATPFNTTYAIIGMGTAVTTVRQNSPINIANNSTHGQSVYTAAALNAAGITGPIQIMGLGFNVVTAPNLALPNFIVRMAHTTATNVAAWIPATGLLTTYSNTSYLPTAGGYDMLTFSTPFTWNGTDNILVDTAFSPVATASTTGTVQYTYVTSGYRLAFSNTADQTNVFTGGIVVGRLPNIRLALQPVPVGPLMSVNPPSIPFGNVAENTSAVQQFTVQNTGDQTLTGNITTPAGYTVSLQAREDETEHSLETAQRNTIGITVLAGNTQTYQLTFNPIATTVYNGNVVIATNASSNPTVNIAVTGTGISSALPTPVVQISTVSSGFKLTWIEVPNASQYEIYSATDPDGPYTLLSTQSELTYTDLRGLPKAFYQVRAIN